MTTDAPRYGHIDRDYALRLATTPADQDGPVWMVNLMKYREVADYADGRDSGISGRQADDLYTPIEALGEVGAEIVFAADVDQQLLGDDVVWDRVAVVKYPTRRAFIEMQSLPSFSVKHPHKEAGMQQTFVIGTQPMAAELPRVVETASWDAVPHPPTADDPYVMVLHVIRFHDQAATDEVPAEMEEYQNHAARIAARHGGSVAGWFAAEGTIVGDGRRWDQMRFNKFPSKAAFMAVALDPERLAAQRDHREVAIADTYTMILRPFIDRLAESAQT